MNQGRGDETLSRCEDVAHVMSEGRVALVDLASLEKTPLVMQGTAADIWRLIDGRRSEEEIVLAISAKYGLSPEAIAPDVTGFLQELQEQGLIRPSDAAATRHPERGDG